jgi:WD40 repeat protein/tRNA A-37 threonylcarbamoyl transferase component Bud32
MTITPNTLGLPAGAADTVTILPTGGSFGDYEALEEIARGGMGIVYKARQKSLNRIVAVKMILTAALASPTEVQRFRKEAEAVALLDHPHIVPIYEVGEHEGRPFFSMKLLEGGTLERQRDELRRDPRRIARLLIVIAQAVHHAHQRGILHRDLKPGNVLLDTDGQPYVADFGLAKQVAGAEELRPVHLTQSGAVVGTPNYMSPEQARGVRALTTAADVYSLGAILYDCLTGKPPFQAATPVETLLQVLECDARPPRILNPQVERDLETIALKCLEKEPQKRYANAQELADDLQRWLAGVPIKARRVGTPERALKWARRRPAIAALVALVLVVAVAGFGAALGEYREAQSARREAADRADREAAAKDEARQALARAENELYFASLTLAERDWHDGNLVRFRQSLDQCPLPLRRWEWYYLDRRSHAELLTLAGHQACLGTVAFSPSGDRLATTAGDGTVRVCDSRTGKPFITLPGNGEYIGGLAWSPDGSQLAVGGSDRQVRLWALRDNPQATILGPLTGMAFAACFHPTKPYLAVATGDLHHPSAPGDISIWDLNTKKSIRTISGQEGSVYAVAYSPDGALLASGSDDMTAVLWDAATGTKVRRLAGHHTAEGAGVSRVLRLQDARGHETAIRLHNSAVFGVAFSPDGTQLATASGDATVKVWQTANGKELHTLRGHKDGVGCVAFSPSGKVIASGGIDHMVRLWSATTGQEIRHFQGHGGEVSSVAFCPHPLDGVTRLATGSADGTVKLWEADQYQDGYLWRGHEGNLFGLAFSPDNRTLAAGSGDLFNPLKAGGIRIFDLIERRERFTLPGHATGIRALAYSPDSQRLASGSGDGAVKLWDLATRQEVRSWQVAKGSVFAVAISPDGRSLAAASGALLFPAQAGEIKVWDVDSGEERQVLRGHQGGVSCLAYSPDGRYLASGSGDRTVKVWDVATGGEVKTLLGHPNPLLAVGWSPDGSKIAAAGGDFYRPEEPGEARLWDVESGAELLKLKGHAQLVSGMAFLPDGERLATSSRDGTVKLWDTRTGRQVISLKANSLYVCCLAVSQDGRWVASGNWSDSVNLWEGPSP